MFFKKKRLILRVFAGLGNQQFQYAYAKTLAIKFNRRLILDTSYFLRRYHPIKSQGYLYPYKLDHFYLSEKKTSWFLREMIGIINFRPIMQASYKKIQSILWLKNFLPFLHVQDDIIDEKLFFSNRDIILCGYFQNNIFFNEFQQSMQHWFLLKSIISEKNKKYLHVANQANSVSIHVRRADYVANNFYIGLTLEYYRLTIDFINKNQKISVILIFSDDLQWAKQNLNFAQNTVFIEEHGPDFEHQYIMSMCHHNVIANSTFSWWAAMLNKHHDKIVCTPLNWFCDVKTEEIIFTPSAWITFP